MNEVFSGEKLVRFKNLCPHSIHLVGDNGAVITFAESGQVARVDVKREKRKVNVQIAPGVILSMEVQDVAHVDVVNLPEPEDGVIFLVSSYVAQFTKRPDVLCPNTDASAIKDEQGRVIGVRGFQNYVDMDAQ